MGEVAHRWFGCKIPVCLHQRCIELYNNNFYGDAYPLSNATI